MLNVLQTIKDEILDDKLLKSCKELVEDNVSFASAIVFVCNSREAKRHMMTLPPRTIDDISWRGLIGTIARRAEADAIVTIDLDAEVDGRRCMTVMVETLLNRYSVVHPYERVGQKVSWEGPREMPLQDRYGDLLPTPAGMAQA